MKPEFFVFYIFNSYKFFITTTVSPNLGSKGTKLYILVGG